MAKTNRSSKRSEEQVSDHASLQNALLRLDTLLSRAVTIAEGVYGPNAAADPFRGMHIGPKDVERILTRAPGLPLFPFEDSDSIPRFSQVFEGNESRLEWLAQNFGLSAFDVDLLIIVLAPEIDLGYERLYAYLQDEITCRRPTVDLVLNLLCSSFEEKLSRRAHFDVDAPLVRNGLVQLVTDSDQPSLLAHELRLDDQIIRFLLQTPGLDRRVATYCDLITPTVNLSRLPFADDLKNALKYLIASAHETNQPIYLYFDGPQGTGARQMIEGLASDAGMPLLVANPARALNSNIDFEQALTLLFREAWTRDAILYLEGLEIFHSEAGVVAYHQLLEALDGTTGITILAGERRLLPNFETPVVINVPFATPDVHLRQMWWFNHLADIGAAVSRTELEVLSTRFRLTPNEIRTAVSDALGNANWRCALAQSSTTDAQPVSPLQPLPTLPELFAAARAQSGDVLATLAQKIAPRYTWADIVLPEDSLAQLHEVCQWVSQRHQVLERWGFERKLSQGKGVNALFAGPSGTGKTMAAEVIAHELELDLYRINLSTVVSKYIGETEKNLDRIFDAAEDANAILFFDEADALFGKRSEVHDSHDRYANIEISYLLQKMEQYDGIALLATNLRQNLDEAFVRRLAFMIHFPFPEPDSRHRIWQGIWPDETPLGDDLDLEFLASQFKLSGGNIKNIALSASFLASADGGVVRMEHLFQATQREYQKMGRSLSEGELYGLKHEDGNHA
jgi:hypothetical protein